MFLAKPSTPQDGLGPLMLIPIFIRFQGAKKNTTWDMRQIPFATILVLVPANHLSKLCHTLSWMVSRKEHLSVLGR